MRSGCKQRFVGSTRWSEWSASWSPETDGRNHVYDSKYISDLNFDHHFFILHQKISKWKKKFQLLVKYIGLSCGRPICVKKLKNYINRYLLPWILFVFFCVFLYVFHPNLMVSLRNLQLLLNFTSYIEDTPN